MATHLTPAEIHHQQAHIHDNAVPNIIAANAACLPLACIAVALRFGCRRLSKIKYEADDWLILAALILYAGFVACELESLACGGGRHSIIAPNIACFAKSVIAGEVTYNFSVACIKLSILRLYHRVFFSNRRFVLILWGVASFVIGYCVANAIGSIFQCLPIRSGWDPDVKHHCLSLSIAGTIIASVNVLTDFIILILPMPILARMRKPLNERLRIMGIFFVGIFVCFVSIYRCVVIHQLTHIDPTWLEVPVDIWTTAELGVGIVCACIPTMRQLFTHTLFKKRSRQPQFEAPPEARVEVKDDTGNTSVSDPSIILHHKRSIPSQSANFAHLGVLGDTIQIEARGKPPPSAP